MAALVEELGKAGLDIEEHDDGVIVRGGARLRPARLDPRDDHRMAMVYALLGAVHPGIVIEDPGCVSKSYPSFFEDFERLHSSSRCVALVGMRGAGKSSVARLALSSSEPLCSISIGSGFPRSAYRSAISRALRAVNL